MSNYIMDSDGSKLFIYEHKNIRLFYEKGFQIEYDEKEDMIHIIHAKEPYFRVISTTDLIMDCVLGMVLEFNGDKRQRAIFELGLNDCCSGYVFKLFDNKGRYDFFLKTYTQSEREDFEIFMECDVNKNEKLPTTLEELFQ